MQSKIYFGLASSGPAESNIVFELVTLDAGNISSNTLTLTQAPVGVSQMMAWVVNGSTFTPTIDFTLTGSTIDFSGSSYVGTLAIGDKIQFIYEVSV
jgi:hypothetical protein